MAKSLFNLGLLLEKGLEGLEQNSKNAAFLYRTAAALGNKSAKYNLAEMRSKVGVPEDRVAVGVRCQ